MEWFDTDEPSDITTDVYGTVVDAEQRPVRLKVEALEIVTCELLEPIQQRAAAPKRVAA